MTPPAKQTIPTGSIAAIITPMHPSGEVDYTSLSALLDWHAAEGTHGIVAAGTTGESPTLSFKEHQTVIARTIEISNGRLPVIAGAGANSTAEAIHLTRMAKEAGAAAALSVVPYYNKPTQEGLYRHFTAITEACDLPLILYDVPARTITKLADDTVARLAQNPAIIGIKDATGEPARVPRLAHHISKHTPQKTFLQYSGDDSTSCEYLLAGGHGVISVTANIAPANMAKMTIAAAAPTPDEAQARRIDHQLQPFHAIQGIEPNPTPVKAALAMQGKIPPGIRLPLLPLSNHLRDKVAQAATAAQHPIT